MCVCIRVLYVCVCVCEFCVFVCACEFCVCVYVQVYVYVYMCVRVLYVRANFVSACVCVLSDLKLYSVMKYSNNNYLFGYSSPSETKTPRVFCFRSLASS